MEKPEALLLAESAHLGYRIGWQRQVAAELRRLHAENERLHQINFSHEVKLSVRGYEIQIADLEAQRDALLEKIKAVIAAEQSEGAGRGGFINTPPTREHQRRVAQAWKELHAAIKAVEEGK